MLVRRERERPNQRKNPNVNIVTMHTTTCQSMEEIEDDIKMDVLKMYYGVLSENADMKPYGHSNFEYHYETYLTLYALSGV